MKWAISDPCVNMPLQERRVEVLQPRSTDVEPSFNVSLFRTRVSSYYNVFLLRIEGITDSPDITSPVFWPDAAPEGGDMCLPQVVSRPGALIHVRVQHEAVHTTLFFSAFLQFPIVFGHSELL